MLTSQMNGGFQPAGARTQADDLCLPSVKGAVLFNPSRIPTRRTAPTPIESVLSDDRPMPLSGNVTIPPGRGRLAIDFTLCDLVNPQRISFRYKLEGFDREWRPALRGRSASYTNLPPGHYRFRVLAGDASSSSVSEAFVNLTIQPAFHQTVWFYALLAAAAGSALWGGFALYARQTRARAALVLRERERLAREMHDTVIQGCVGISTLLEAAERFRDHDAAEAEALLDQARAQIKNTLDEAREAVWDLHHREAGESSIAMLFEPARKLGDEYGIQIETETVGKGSLDAETDRTLLLAGREGLRHAVSHARPGRIKLRIEFLPSGIGLELTDDGAGFVPEPEDTAQNRHFGIVGMRERVEKLGGAFSIVSSPRTGTRVSARLPLSRPQD